MGYVARRRDRPSEPIPIAYETLTRGIGLKTIPVNTRVLLISSDDYHDYSDVPGPNQAYSTGDGYLTALWVSVSQPRLELELYYDNVFKWHFPVIDIMGDDSMGLLSDRQDPIFQTYLVKKSNFTLHAKGIYSTRFVPRMFEYFKSKCEIKVFNPTSKAEYIYRCELWLKTKNWIAPPP